VSAFGAWAVAGLFLSLIPSFVVVVLGHHNLAVASSVLALMLGVSAVAQLVALRFEFLRTQTAGLSIMIIGVTALMFAVVHKSLVLLLVASVLAGIGQGLALWAHWQTFLRSHQRTEEATSWPPTTSSST
jgi:Na+/melibiose symporter-like transporter